MVFLFPKRIQLRTPSVRIQRGKARRDERHNAVSEENRRVSISIDRSSAQPAKQHPAEAGSHAGQSPHLSDHVLGYDIRRERQCVAVAACVAKRGDRYPAHRYPDVRD